MQTNSPSRKAREKLFLDKADPELVALYRSNEAHSLANAIEEKVDAGVDINSNDNNNNNNNNKNPHHQNNICSNLMNPSNKRNWNEKNKIFDGESGTTPKANILGAKKKKNHQKGQQKQKKSEMKSEEARSIQKNGSAQPYAGNNKNKHVQTSAKSGGQHQFNKGGKKFHQSCNLKNRRSCNHNGRGGGK